MFGPDSTSSLNIDEVKELVKGVRFIEKSLTKIDKNDNTKFKELKNIFEKSLCINKDLKKGSIISFNDLDAKKPANKGIKASNYKNILGKRLNKDLEKWDFLREEDIDE
jgi:N-acetylneuraminate synthase